MFYRLFLRQDISLGIGNYCFLLTGEVFLVCYQNASKNLVTNKVTLILFFHKAPKEALAQCVLAEIPQQVVGYFNTYKLLPPKNPAKKWKELWPPEQNSFVLCGAMDSSPSPNHESIILHAFHLQHLWCKKHSFYTFFFFFLEGSAKLIFTQ